MVGLKGPMSSLDNCYYLTTEGLAKVDFHSLFARLIRDGDLFWHIASFLFIIFVLSIPLLA